MPYLVAPEIRRKDEEGAYCKLLGVRSADPYAVAYAQFQYLKRLFAVTKDYHDTIDLTVIVDDTHEADEWQDDLVEEMAEMKCFDDDDFTINDVFTERLIQLNDRHPAHALYDAAMEITRIAYPGRIRFKLDVGPMTKGLEMGVRLFIIFAYAEVPIPDHYVPLPSIRLK